MQQILQNLADIHRTGIVHRDVKPQNMILSGNGLRMIDLGAAADLRIGINYVPNEYLLDPRYAPPEQYIMSPLTPRHASSTSASLTCVLVASNVAAALPCLVTTPSPSLLRPWRSVIAVSYRDCWMP